MSTIDAPSQSFNRSEPIPGYHLLERIGEGGFGEVWKSDAPGGLVKAVKIVYGAVNTSKAERELKALNRVKQVHHPLLLSLERIEVIDSHLVIVTELADCSLSDRFQMHTESGHPGIPRDELMVYLGDAADALDYLYTEHSLQHLDVKPENLLLLAGRVKVADFGMVKDLHDRGETVIGGLTPLYAPPEIYDGRPNQHSDQYSLAIVYHQMLTGEPPFDGRTAAQLAAQHLHSEPNLSRLSDSDRRVVGRALEKDPSRRFGSCREFIQVLREGRDADRQRRDRPPASKNRRRRSARSDSTLSLAETVTEFPKPTEVTKLPPLEEVTPSEEILPTVFIGVGGAAAACLGHARQKLPLVLGGSESVPANQFLLVDTDVPGLAAQTHGNSESGFRMTETVAMPIQDASHYRANSDDLLQWLERRWLYNVPRSRSTEGIRPIGRLALVDNFDRVVEAIRRAIETALDEELLKSSSEATGHKFATNRVRVFLVGSMTGGTASGSLLDLAYATRAVLEEMGLPDDQVCGVLLYLTGSEGKSTDLQLANTVAFLREFDRFSTRGAYYPGEPTCGIPSFEKSVAPFAHTYVAHLGESLATRDFQTRTRMVGDFLSANCLPAVGEVFESARGDQPYREYEKGDVRIRGFSLAQLGGKESGEEAAAEYLCRSLVRRWLGEDSRAHLNSKDLETLAAKFTDGLGLNFESLMKRSLELTTDGVLVPDSSVFIQHLAIEATKAASDVEVADANKALMESVDELLGERPTQSSTSAPQKKSWSELASERLAGDAERRVEAFLDWFGMLAKQPKIRLRGVQHTVKWLVERLSELEKEVLNYSANRAGGQLPLTIENPNSIAPYCETRLHQVADRRVLGYLRTVTVGLQEYGVRLQELCRRLDDFSQQFAVPDKPEGLPEIESVHKRRWQFLAEMEETLDEQSLGMEALNDLTNLSAKHWSALAASLRKLSKRIVAGASARDSISHLAGDQDTASPQSTLSSVAREAVTELRACGGQERMIVLLPAAAPSTDLQEQAEFQGATLVTTPDERVTICHEMSDVPVANLVVKLSGGRQQCLQLAERLQTRVDIRWD